MVHLFIIAVIITSGGSRGVRPPPPPPARPKFLHFHCIFREKIGQTAGRRPPLENPLSATDYSAVQSTVPFKID